MVNVVWIERPKGVGSGKNSQREKLDGFATRSGKDLKRDQLSRLDGIGKPVGEVKGECALLVRTRPVHPFSRELPHCFAHLVLKLPFEQKELAPL